MTQLLAQAYEAGLRGELDEVHAALANAGDDPWAFALRGLCWFAGEDVALVDATAIARPGAGDAVLRAGLHATRARVLRSEPEEARELVTALRNVDPSASCTVIAAAWVDLAAGTPLDDPGLESAAQRARREGSSDLVIEATALRALGAAAADALDEALRLARQSSRMARTESIPQMEHFAHLALARVRRLCGKPHLSTRIIAGLGRVATAPWRSWLCWELLLAQGRLGAGPLAEATALSASLANVLQSARAGDRAIFDGWVRHLTAEAQGFAPFAEDLRWALPALDPAVPLTDAPARLAAFLAGDAPHEPPRGLAGICGAEAEEGEHLVWIAAPAARSPRRLLAPALALARAGLAAEAFVNGSEKQIRTHSAIAVLTLSGAEGLDEGELFRALYGFGYEPERHQAVRGVLYGRVRKKLGELAELVRGSGAIRLEAAGDLLVCDPRCTPPPELRILAVLARRREAAPKDVAKALGISVRSAQDALRRLSEDGALRSERAGRGLHYILEDTTYAEPTRRRRG